jgi:hypothetical protein
VLSYPAGELVLRGWRKLERRAVTEITLPSFLSPPKERRNRKLFIVSHDFNLISDCSSVFLLSQTK